MPCDVMVMSCYLMCPAMGWNVMSLRCHWLWGHVVWSEVVLWPCGDPKYYSVLQSTTTSTTKYYSSTTKYYSNTSSVLQSTTLLYYSTTLYCKVLLQYYSVLQSTTLQYYPVLQSTTPVLLCTTTYYSSTTLYYKVATQVLLHYYSVHCTERRSDKSQPPLEAPAMQNETHDWSHMKHDLQCAGQQESASNFTKYCACHAKRISWSHMKRHLQRAKQVKSPFKTHQVLPLQRNSEFKIWARNPLNSFRQYKDDSRIIRTESEHKIVISHPPLRRRYSSHLGDAFCTEKTTFRAPAISQNVTKCCACHEKSTPTSPNTAPATKNDTPPHHSLRMPRYEMQSTLL